MDFFSASVPPSDRHDNHYPLTLKHKMIIIGLVVAVLEIILILMLLRFGVQWVALGGKSTEEEQQQPKVPVVPLSPSSRQSAVSLPSGYITSLFIDDQQTVTQHVVYNDSSSAVSQKENDISNFKIQTRIKAPNPDDVRVCSASVETVTVTSSKINVTRSAYRPLRDYGEVISAPPPKSGIFIKKDGVGVDLGNSRGQGMFVIFDNAMYYKQQLYAVDESPKYTSNPFRLVFVFPSNTRATAFTASSVPFSRLDLGTRTPFAIVVVEPDFLPSKSSITKECAMYILTLDNTVGSNISFTQSVIPYVRAQSIHVSGDVVAFLGIFTAGPSSNLKNYANGFVNVLTGVYDVSTMTIASNHFDVIISNVLVSVPMIIDVDEISTNTMFAIITERPQTLMVWGTLSNQLDNKSVSYVVTGEFLIKGAAPVTSFAFTQSSSTGISTQRGSHSSVLTVTATAVLHSDLAYDVSRVVVGVVEPLSSKTTSRRTNMTLSYSPFRLPKTIDMLRVVGLFRTSRYVSSHDRMFRLFLQTRSNPNTMSVITMNQNASFVSKDVHTLFDGVQWNDGHHVVSINTTYASYYLVSLAVVTVNERSALRSDVKAYLQLVGASGINVEWTAVM
jgi:hypothetical protein